MVEARGFLNFVSAAIISYSPFIYDPGFPVQQVASAAESLAKHSWEFGTTSQALLELYDPLLSVFGPTPFPVQASSTDQVKALAYAASKITFGQNENVLADGAGAVGDPASLGVSAIMLGKTIPKFGWAADSTIKYLLHSAPRYSNGAISQRVSTPELWADFMYMAPPFIAFYAADKNNETLLYESVKQCGYYREVLQSNTTQPYNGAWRHIIGPNHQDYGHWSTGNGWAAAGMLRVLATVMKAPVAQNASWKEGAIYNLTTWITEIIDGAIGSSMAAGLLRNYFDDMDPKAHGFGEVSGSSLLASVVYRMAILRPDVWKESYVSWAEGIRRVLGGKDAYGNPHVTADGIVTPAVNPMNWLDPLPGRSPEAEAFVLIMYSAWRDCKMEGSCPVQGNVSRRREVSKRRLHENLKSRHR